MPAPRPLKERVPLVYFLSRLAHAQFFNPKSILYSKLKPIANFIDRSKRLKRFFEFSEHITKVVLFDCMNCGDCALVDAGYICPMSQCPKQQRNGPCGGSFEGWCEAYPNERKCMWVQAYSRLKRFGDDEQIGSYVVEPCNWELMQSSSWLNFYLGRDHTAKRLDKKCC